MSLKKEEITVLIPAYNAQKTIKKTIDAILKQTYDQKLIKLIICNDGSTDKTLEILEDYKKQFPTNDKIKIINQKNKGLSITRKILLDQVKTKWCCFCDADDFYMPNAFSEMVKCIKSDTQMVVSKII
jgi:glycosyltransferase involved in cell wall biosynthesis